MVNMSAAENTAALREPRVIVSLTTYPGRIDRVHMAIESLLRQTVPADMIVLWLAREQFPSGEADLPEPLLAQRERGLHIEWCEDIKSFKKLIPAAERFPDDIIITADDDIVYRADAIELLLRCHERCPGCVCALRTHLMTFAEDGALRPYGEWMPEYSEFVGQPRMALFPTTGAGTLFPPGVLPLEAFDREAFMSLCPKADDVWTKVMLTLAGVPVALAATNTRLQFVEGTQTESLWEYNREENGNDAQLQAVLSRYNIPVEQLTPDETLVSRMNDLPGHQPSDKWCQKFRTGRSYVNEKLGMRVSIIISDTAGENELKRCVRSAASQSIEDIEIFCVSSGADDKKTAVLEALAALDERVRVVCAAENIGLCEARKSAVLASKGEYILFSDADGALAPDACEALYASAEQNDADILAFTRGVIRRSREGAQADPLFDGAEGRLRARAIVQREFSAESKPYGRLCGKLFSGRLCRKAYLFARGNALSNDEYEYLLLASNAEMYFGEETQVLFAAPAPAAPSYSECARTDESIRVYSAFAKKDKENAALCDAVNDSLLDCCFDRWYALASQERPEEFDRLVAAWGRTEAALGLARLCSRVGFTALDSTEGAKSMECAPRSHKSIGIVTQGAASASELFQMTELLGDIARDGREAALIGLSREAAASIVIPAKAALLGGELNSPEKANERASAIFFSDILGNEHFDVVLLSVADPRFTRLALQCRLGGVAVCAVMTDPVGAQMLSCAPCAASPAQLALSSVTVTDSPRQERLLAAMGIRARYIPRPAMMLMGGRSSHRASADAIVWTGDMRETVSHFGDAVRIFSLVSAACREARMLMYIDRPAAELEQLAVGLPEGVQLRRLRPDLGIFDDAAIHLMTRSAALDPAPLRAACTLGIPTVMYRGEGETCPGAMAVDDGDTASAARAITTLLRDKAARDRLGAQAHAESERRARSREDELWSAALEAAADGHDGRLTLAEGKAELRALLGDIMACYDVGSAYNAGVLREFNARCADYERRLSEADALYEQKTADLQKKLEKEKQAAAEARRQLGHARSELEGTRASTAYKAGRALTFLPRKAKQLIKDLTARK